MAFTVVNTTIPKLTRGRAWNLSAISGSGPLTAADQAYEFTLGFVDYFNQRKFVVQASGAKLATPTGLLEGSLDGGVSWFAVPELASDLTLTGTADPAADFVARYDVSGISGGALYRFGFTAGTFTGNENLWAAID